MPSPRAPPMCFVFLGYLLGENWGFVVTGLHRYMVFFAAMVVVVLAVYALLRSAVLRHRQ